MHEQLPTTVIPIVLTHPNAKVPTQDPGNVGFDVACVESGIVLPGETKLIKTGISLADNFQCRTQHSVSFIKVEGRSGLASRGVFPVGGIVDPNYRGDIGVLLHNSSRQEFSYEAGNRIAQLVVYQVHATDESFSTVFVKQEEQKKTSRGDKGFGSSGI